MRFFNLSVIWYLQSNHSKIHIQGGCRLISISICSLGLLKSEYGFRMSGSVAAPKSPFRPSFTAIVPLSYFRIFGIWRLWQTFLWNDPTSYFSCFPCFELIINVNHNIMNMQQSSQIHGGMKCRARNLKQMVHMHYYKKYAYLRAVHGVELSCS